jgi:glycosyltransferase involved in cell wall biosynthesis
MYVSLENDRIVAASNNPLSGKGIKKISTNISAEELVGKKIGTIKDVKDLMVAAICNWGDECGIATYSKFLLDAIKLKVKDLHIFSEGFGEEVGVTKCWERGKSPGLLLKKIKEYAPDFVIIQHEFGIFPRAGHFLQLLQGLEDFPYALTFHSVYEHLDKAICTAAVKNAIVHTVGGEEVLRKTGYDGKIFVIPHGCIDLVPGELWNIFQTPYAIVQFGFGFYYKGVDTALEAIAILKNNQPDKYENLFYCYLCSEGKHCKSIHDEYYRYLLKKINELNVTENVAIIRKYQTEQSLSNYLKTAKLAIFPYRSDPNNIVYGASGAVRVAMAHKIPVICGKNHQFDELDDVLPRAGTAEELAIEIDKIFSDEVHKNCVIDKATNYVVNNSWSITADRYLDLYKKVIPSDIVVLN